MLNEWREREEKILELSREKMKRQGWEGGRERERERERESIRIGYS